MHDFASSTWTEEASPKVRERLVRISDHELQRELEAVEYMCSKRATWGKACNVCRVTSVDAVLPDLNALDLDGLKALVIATHTELISHKNEIESLKLLILKLKRMQFGRSSEKLGQQIDQLELLLEDLEVNRAVQAEFAAPSAQSVRRKPARRPLPADLPRETENLEPRETACPDCGGNLNRLGEDVSETLEYVPEHFKVIRTVRPKLSCTRCDCIVQAPAPHRPIARGLAGPALLAHVLVAKYCDHLPLYRQSEICERKRLDLDRSTLADWVGGASHTLEPLVDALRKYVLAGGKLHGDDIPVPVLAPGNGKTKTGRLWTYVRDERPAASRDAPAVWFAYSPDRKAEQPAEAKQDISYDTGFASDDSHQDCCHACLAPQLKNNFTSPVVPTIGPQKQNAETQQCSRN